MEEQKVNFMYPNPSSSLSQQQTNFTTSLDPPPLPLPSSSLIGHPTNFTVQRQTPQVTITQIYPVRKMKTVKNSFRKRSCSNTIMPYYIPLRHRTKSASENQDNSMENATMECEMEMDYTAQQTANSSQFNKIKLVQKTNLKKSKSLESLCSKTESKKDKEQNYSTMEFFDLNHQIQKLNLRVHD